MFFLKNTDKKLVEAYYNFDKKQAKNSDKTKIEHK